MIDSRWCTGCHAIIAILDKRGRCGVCGPEALVVDAPPPGHTLLRTSDGGLYHVPSGNIAKAKAVDPKLAILYVEPARADDGTIRLLRKHGIPVTRENYLRLSFMGNPPEEPLDGELESELPRELQRNENRLFLTDDDRQFLRDVGITSKGDSK
jgi:hypothetical protein